MGGEIVFVDGKLTIIEWQQPYHGGWLHMSQESSMQPEGRVVQREDIPGRQTDTGVCMHVGQLVPKVAMVELSYAQ